MRTATVSRAPLHRAPTILASTMVAAHELRTGMVIVDERGKRVGRVKLTDPHPTCDRSNVHVTIDGSRTWCYFRDALVLVAL